MEVEIITSNFQLNVYGFSGIATNKDYTETAFRLSGRMWQYLKAKNIKNKGKNIWIYEDANKVFTGVELEINNSNDGLEHKNITLNKYAYYKHIGPYSLIKQAGQKMTNELKEKGFDVILPYIEIYGHWTNDESKLETELIMSIN